MKRHRIKAPPDALGRYGERWVYAEKGDLSNHGLSYFLGPRQRSTLFYKDELDLFFAWISTTLDGRKYVPEEIEEA